MNLVAEWRKRRASFANPAHADDWIMSAVQRLNERLDSVEKAVTDLQEGQPDENDV